MGLWTVGAVEIADQNSESKGTSDRKRGETAMGTEQDDAIVLRVTPWSETSCVVTLLTRQQGKRALVAKGARRPKSPFEAALDLLSLCHVVFIPKTGDALDILTEARLQRRFRAASRDLLRLYCGYYVAELLDRLTDIGDSHPELFDLAVATIEQLDTGTADVRSVVLRFELGVLRHTGHLPSLERCVECGVTWESSTDEGEQQGWYLFSAAGGGVYCTHCKDRARQSIRMGAAPYRALLAYSQPDWRRIDVDTFPDNSARVVRRVVRDTMRHLLDRPPRMEPYLQDLQRS